MVYHYYVQSQLVIEYADKYGVMHKTITNTIIKKKYILSIPDNDSNDNYEKQFEKYNKELQKYIKKNTYNKMLYETDKWVKETYKKRYNKYIWILCPNLHKLLKIYKQYSAWNHI